MLLLACLPVVAAAAAAVGLTSSGNAFFGHERVGRGGRRFRCWKIRTMAADAEERLRTDPALHESYRQNSFKLPDDIDPRVTPVGRFLRQTSIDELPQLWNVLNGTMSLVGPRPNLESEVRQYRLHELGRLAVRPGITCFWQVQGRAELPWERQVELDLDYVHQRSFKTDVRLLLKTIPAVLTGRGAY